MSYKRHSTVVVRLSLLTWSNRLKLFLVDFKLFFYIYVGVYKYKYKNTNDNYIYTPIIICLNQFIYTTHGIHTGKQEELTKCWFAVKPASLSVEQTYMNGVSKLGREVTLPALSSHI